MAIQAVLDEDAFTALDEPLQAFYRKNEGNGNYYLDLPAEEAGKLAFNLKEDIEKLKAHNERVLGEKKKFQTKLSELEDELKAKPKQDDPPQDFEDERKALQSSFQKELEKERERANGIRQQVADSIKTATIAKLRAEHDLNETAEYVLKDFIRVVPESEGSDHLVARVYEDGKPAYVAGDYKAPDVLLQEWKEQGKMLGIFNAPKGGGTGGRSDYRSGRSGKNTMKRSTFDGLSADEKIAFSRDGGQLID